jgi:hypothetical protein
VHTRRPKSTQDGEAGKEVGKGMERPENRTRMAHKMERPPAKRSGRSTRQTDEETGRHTRRKGGRGNASMVTKLVGRGGRLCQPASSAVVEDSRAQTLVGRCTERDLHGRRLGGKQKIGV